MRKIILIITTLFNLNLYSSDIEEIYLGKNESILALSSSQRPIRITCDDSSVGTPAPMPIPNAPDKCYLAPNWREGSLSSFRVYLRDQIWEELFLKDFGQRRRVALKAAKRSLNLLIADGLCY